MLGEVVSGTEVVDAIGQVPTSGDPLNVPLDPVIIERSCCPDVRGLLIERESGPMTISALKCEGFLVPDR